VQFMGGACVAHIRREGDVWVLLDAANKVLASANIVVLAAAGGCTQLLGQLRTDMCADTGFGVPALLAVSGQISWAVQRPADTPALPPYPVNGLGSLVAHVPVNDETEARMAWFTGATYETPWAAGSPSIAAQHSANYARLKTLLPACAQTLAAQFNDGSVQAWRGTRHAPADHLPVVGPLIGPLMEPGKSGDSPALWISTGLGSRGLSLSVLCAELLAAHLGAEPLPVEATLARALYSER
jgi:tRNA 5-methylaminomethyl-2-thiouridine biosynthesis bifunctional protein